MFGIFRGSATEAGALADYFQNNFKTPHALIIMDSAAIRQALANAQNPGKLHRHLNRVNSEPPFHSLLPSDFPPPYDAHFRMIFHISLAPSLPSVQKKNAFTLVRTQLADFRKLLTFFACPWHVAYTYPWRSAALPAGLRSYTRIL